MGVSPTLRLEEAQGTQLVADPCHLEKILHLHVRSSRLGAPPAPDLPAVPGPELGAFWAPILGLC